MCVAFRTLTLESKVLRVSRAAYDDLANRAEAEPNGRLARAMRSGRVQVSGGRSRKLSAAQRARRQRRRGAGALVIDGYHGTNARFRKFSRSKAGSAAGHRAGEAGTWTTSDPILARAYAKMAARRGGGRARIVRTRQRFKRPLVHDAGGKPIYDVVKGRALSVSVRDAQRRGHDGIVYRNVRDGPGKIENVRPSTVAISFGNRGLTIRPRRARRSRRR